MSVTPVEIPLPAEFLSTGDHALIVAWTDTDHGPAAVLCLEDGRSVLAGMGDFKFDYRYDLNRQRFVDVSGVPIGDDEPEGDDEDDGESDQEPPSDGSEEVPGHVPDADGAGEGDPG